MWAMCSSIDLFGQPIRLWIEFKLQKDGRLLKMDVAFDPILSNPGIGCSNACDDHCGPYNHTSV